MGMLNNSWHRPARGKSERDDANWRVVLGQPLRQVPRATRAFHLDRVDYCALTQVTTYIGARPAGREGPWAGSTRIRRK